MSQSCSAVEAGMGILPNNLRCRGNQVGRPAVVACYAGAVEYGHKVLRPLKTFGSPVLDMAGFGKQITSSITSFALWQIGGAVAHVGESETAFNGLQHRA